MQIRKSKYKNIFAIDIITDKYFLKVLPSEGGKIASFITKKDAFEFLVQNPCKTYKKLYTNGDFVMSECSGFDDMFPTIDAVEFVDDSGRKLHYPDYGEVCSGNFDYFIIKDGFPFFKGDITLTQKITVNDTGKCVGKMMFDNELDLSGYLAKGKNEIEITLTAGNRNLLGPFHTIEEEPLGVGPDTFERFGTWKNGKSDCVKEYYAFVKTIV